MIPFIAQTDKRWFDFLTSRADGERIDEADLWSSKSQCPMKHMSPGEPVSFRQKSPVNTLARGGPIGESRFAEDRIPKIFMEAGASTPDILRRRTR